MIRRACPSPSFASTDGGTRVARRAAFVLLQVLMLAVGTTPALADDRPVIFLPGLCDNRTLWDYYEGQLGHLSRYRGRTDMYFNGVDVLYSRNDPSARFFVADFSYDPTTRAFDASRAANIPIFQKAAALKAMIDLVKSRTGSVDVLLLSHSMGGLIGRAYIEGLARPSQGAPAIPFGGDVAALFTVGTPNLGSTLANFSLPLNLGPCGTESNLNKDEMEALNDVPRHGTLIAMNSYSGPLPTYIVSFAMVDRIAGQLVGDGVVSPASQRIDQVFPGDAKAIVQELRIDLAIDPLRPLLTFHQRYLKEGNLVQVLHGWVLQSDALLPSCFAPVPPTLRASVRTSATGSVVDLVWNQPERATPGTTYALDAGSTPGGVQYGSSIGVGSVTSQSFAVGPGTYYVRLRARNACGAESSASTEVRIDVAPPGAATPPLPPILSAPVVLGSTVNLSWTPKGGGVPATSYQLGYSLVPGGAFVPLVTYTSTSTSIAGVPNGTYYVRVRGMNGSIAGSPSNEVAVVVGAPPPTVSRLTVARTGSGTGTVTSNPLGINCGTDCQEDYAVNAIVALSATPATGSTFTGWSGDADCIDGSVTMSAARSCSANFSIGSPGAPAVIVTPPVNTTAPYNGIVTFTVAATGAAPLTYQWFNNGNPLANGTNVTGANGSTLTMRQLQGFNAGTVGVEVRNAFGTDRVTVTLTVTGVPGF